MPLLVSLKSWINVFDTETVFVKLCTRIIRSLYKEILACTFGRSRNVQESYEGNYVRQTRRKKSDKEG